jgi:hypothetical protein
MVEDFGWIKDIQFMHRTSTSLLDCPLKVRMCPKGSRVPVSMERRRESPVYMSGFIHIWGGHTTKIDPILPKTVRTDFYVIASKVMRYYYKGECTLDSLSVVDFYANGVVFNRCNYLLEELLVACEEAQEKGGNFTYGYLLVAFIMLKWTPPVGIPLSPANKG